MIGLIELPLSELPLFHTYLNFSGAFQMNPPSMISILSDLEINEIKSGLPTASLMSWILVLIFMVSTELCIHIVQRETKTYNHRTHYKKTVRHRLLIVSYAIFMIIATVIGALMLSDVKIFFYHYPFLLLVLSNFVLLVQFLLKKRSS